MNRVLVLLIFLGLQSVAQAQDATLKDHMKQLGEEFRTIGVGLSQGVLVQQQMDAAHKIEQIIINASQILPETASTEEKILLYSNLMQELLNASVALQEEIAQVLKKGGNPQNLQGVIRLMQVMGEIRAQGHEEFKI